MVCVEISCVQSGTCRETALTFAKERERERKKEREKILCTVQSRGEKKERALSGKERGSSLAAPLYSTVCARISKVLCFFFSQACILYFIFSR